MTKQSYSGQNSDPAATKTRPDTKTDHLHRHRNQSGRDDRLDEELERERLEPGLNTEGTGGAGADPRSPHDGGNSNT